MPILPSDVAQAKVLDAKFQTKALNVEFLPKGQKPPPLGQGTTFPFQKRLNLGDTTSGGNKKHWIYRVEYRIRMNDDSWSMWCVWSRQPNSYIRKSDAERRLKQIVDKIQKSRLYDPSYYDSFEFAVRPHCLGYDVSEARRYAKKVKMVKALDKVWADKAGEQ